MKQQASRVKLYEKRMSEARGLWKPEDFSQRILVPDRKIMILSDVHAPFHDEKLLAQAFSRAEDEGVTAIIFLGDLIDAPTFSSWGREDWNDNFEREIGIVETILQCALEAAPVVYWSRGNHEQRIFRKVENQIKMRNLAALFEMTEAVKDGRLILSDNPSLDAFGGTWMLTHPKAYGRQPLVETGKLATLFQQNVVGAHAHHFAHGLDQTSKFEVIESGGLFKPEYFQYIQYNVTSHRAWTQGYWILEDGVPTGYRPLSVASKKMVPERRMIA